ERRAAVPLHGGDLAARQLRDAARGRRTLGEAVSRRRAGPLRLAEGQVRSVVADRADGARGEAERQGSGEGAAGRRGDDADGQAGHRAVEAGVRRQVNTMKFMLMMQGTRAGWESMHTWSHADIKAHLGHMKDLVRKLSASGELV